MPAPRHPQAKDTARVHFDKWAVSYDRSWLNELVFFPSVRACQEEILRWQRLRGDAPLDLLDVGCGTGTLLMLLSRHEFARRLVGIDYSAKMVELAGHKFATLPTADKLEIVHGDAEHLPFADGSFDVLTCCNSFHHYPHQDAVLREFRRVLRPGGMLILIDGFRDNVIGWLIFDVFVEGIEKHVHHAAWSLVRRLATEAGFAAVRQRKMNVLAPLLVTVATTHLSTQPAAVGETPVAP